MQHVTLQRSLARGRVRFQRAQLVVGVRASVVLEAAARAGPYPSYSIAKKLWEQRKFMEQRTA
jgi:hypothetical protein